MKLHALCRWMAEDKEYLASLVGKDTFVVVSINDPMMNAAKIPEMPNCRGVLALYFEDLDEHLVGYSTFSEADARAIWYFVDQHKDVQAIVCHCFAGMCRSPAAAGAIAMALNGDDSEFMDNKRYRPNRLVYDTLLMIREEKK